MTRAILLCAGYGTRLGDLGTQRPKPMLPVCNLPILRYGIALLRGHGITDIAINLHHRGELIEREIGDGSALGVRIHYVREPEQLLGTGGGIKNALDVLDPDGDDEPIVSLNGKLIFDVDLSALLDAFRAAENTASEEILGMMVVRRVPDALEWGAVDVAVPDDSFARVKDILGSGAYMFCGVHVTRPSVVRRLPEGEACMVRQGYLPWIQRGGTVAGFVTDSERYFAEHSTPERYLQSNIDLLRGAPLNHPPGSLLGVDPEATVHPSAVIRPPVVIAPGAVIEADAVVGPEVVVGDDAVVTSGTRVERAVIWPGARASGQLSQRIVTPAGVINAE